MQTGLFARFNCFIHYSTVECSKWFFSTNHTDAYVQVWLEPLGLKLAETRVVEDNLNPSWKEVFHIMSCFDAEKIRVVVKDSDMSWTAAVMSICPSISRFVYISAQPKQINITWLFLAMVFI